MNFSYRKHGGNCFGNSPFFITVLLTSLMVSSCVTMSGTKQEEEYKTSIDELRLSSANNTQAIEELKAENERLKGEIEKVTFLIKQSGEASDVRLLAIESKLGAKNVVAAPISTTTETGSTDLSSMDVDSRYKLAKKYHEKEQFDEAEKYYRSIVGSPSKWYEERALYYIGVMNYDKKDYEKAVIALQEFADAYPNSKNVSSALLFQGDSLVALGKNDEAKLFFEDLVSRFPRSKEAKDAKKRLKK